MGTVKYPAVISPYKTKRKSKVENKTWAFIEVVETESFPIDNNFHCDATQREQESMKFRNKFLI